MSALPIETWLLGLLLGSCCGLFGQGIRSIVGLYKLSQIAMPPDLSWTRLVLSLIIGVLAGALASIVVITSPTVIPIQLLALVSAGYAGADFIEGFIGNYMPGKG